MKMKIALLLLFFISSLYSREGDALFNSIHSYLKLYRQFIEEEDLTINNGVINLALDGRRTNHKSLLLLGFYTVGRQVQKNDLPFRKVQIIINYKMKDTQQMAFTASMESVLSLAQGRINPDQFFDEIHY